jgi:hypothetical protein
MLRNKESNVKGFLGLQHSLQGWCFILPETHLVIGKMAAGMTIDEVMTEYDLKREDILNVLSYAATLMKEEEIRVAE